VEQMVCHTQVSSYLRDRPRRVSYQPDCFVFKFLRGPPSCLGDHSVLRFHHSPPSGGVCEIRGRSQVRALKSADDFKTATALISNLSICMNGHFGYRLLKDKLVYNQGNFRSGQVTEISKNLGLSNLWNSVCESSEIEVYTGESNLDLRKNRLITKWNELFDERDLVVHRISQATGWAPERIQESLVLSRLVVKNISMCLLRDAHQLIESKNRPALPLETPHTHTISP